jgi:hypothetical protein
MDLIIPLAIVAWACYEIRARYDISRTKRTD